MKTLRLLRHAKSDWSQAVQDHDRPLNRRGAKARQVIAEHVRGWPVELVISSDAKRALETAEPVVEALGCPLRVEPRVYATDAAGLLELVRGLPADVRDVMVVGHNPTLEELIELLCRTTARLRTATLATLTLDIDTWMEATPGCGTLVDLVTAADLR